MDNHNAQRLYQGKNLCLVKNRVIKNHLKQEML